MTENNLSPTLLKYHLFLSSWLGFHNFESVCVHYKIMQEFFSLNGFDFWELNPTRRQSSCWCSLIYLIISWMAWDTLIRFRLASLRSCSVICFCCWRLVIIISMMALSDRPILTDFLGTVWLGESIRHFLPEKCISCWELGCGDECSSERKYSKTRILAFMKSFLMKLFDLYLQLHWQN